MTDRPCRTELLNHINAVSFAVDEVKLYLDTHPQDPDALAYFEKYSRMRNQAMKEYAMNFGRLIQPQHPAVNTGNGSMSRGRGRKEDADYVEL